MMASLGEPERTACFVNFMLFFTICGGANVLPYLTSPPTVTMENYTMPTALTVRWLPWETDGSGDGPIIGYEVVYRYESEVDGDTSYNNSLAVDSNVTTSAVITGLALDKEYDFAIIVIGEGGERGPPTNKTTAKTGCSVPTAAATIMLTTMGPSEISVSWELPPPSTWGCRQIGENVFLEYKLSSDSVFRWLLVDAAPDSYNLTSLNPCLDYDVRLRFLNSNNFSPTSLVVTATTAKTEPPPVGAIFIDNVPNSLEFQVRWFESASYDVECVEQYRVTNTPLRMIACGTDVASPVTRVKVVPANSTSVLFADLMAYTEYNVSVTSSNDLGNSSVRFQTWTTLSTVPSVLPAVQVTDIAERSVRLTWDRIPCENVHGFFFRYMFMFTNNETGEAFSSFMSDIDSTELVESLVLPCRTYDVKTAVENSKGIGPYSESVQFSTLPEVPYTVRNHAVSSLDDDPNALLVTWEAPEYVYCPIDYYQVTYDLVYKYQCESVNDGDRVIATNTTSTSYTITGLFPYSTYFVYIMAHSEAGFGTRVTAGYKTHVTAEKAPTVPPSQVEVFSTDARSLYYSWQRPGCNGTAWSSRLLGYAFILVNLDNTSEPVVGEQESLAIRFENLLPYTRYAFQVLMRTNAGDGPYSEPAEGRTLADVPGPPSSLSVTNKTETTVTIAWQAPTVPNGIIVYYTIQYRVIERPYDPNFYLGDQFTEQALLGPDNFTSILTYLDPGTKYQIRVAGLTPPGEGEFVYVEVFTEPKSDIPKPNDPVIDPSRTTETSVFIYLSSPDDTYVTSYLIAVKKMPLRAKRTSVEIDGEMYGTHGENPDAYIAAEIPKQDNDGGFVVGDGQKYGDYLNAPLEKGMYSIRAGGKSKTDEASSFSWSVPVLANVSGSGGGPIPTDGPNQTDPPPSDMNTVGIIAGVIVALVLVIIIVGLVAFYLKKRREQELISPNETALEERKTSSNNV